MDTCPKCNLQSVQHENGGTYCHTCGYALSEGDVEPSIPLGPSGEQQGHYVSTSGKVAGKCLDVQRNL